jgi:protein-L-isoaspartate(D-aspartate) O-methyltransferase
MPNSSADLDDGMPEDESAADISQAEETVAFLLSLRAKGIRDTGVLRAMEMVPRDLFAPRRFADLARADVSLPLPCGQTMTAPATIAAMLVELGVEPHHRVLEVGTGSGYVSAVLGRMGRDVLTVERFRTLAIAATERIGALGLQHVRIATGDGLAIGPEIGPFDRVLLNGSVTEVPKGLRDALAMGGRLVGARIIEGAARLLRVQHTGEGILVEERRETLKLPPLAAGAARAL